MSFVGADLGASGTRFVSDAGKISIMPNNMVFMAVNTRVDQKPYDDNIESALEVIITKEGESEYFPLKVLVGQMAERYSSNNERPSEGHNKHVQKINYVSGIISAALSKLMYNFSDDVHLYVALPPIEVQTAKDIVTDKFIGKYTIEFPKFRGGVQLELNIVDVSCYEESYMAMVSYFFELTGSLRDVARKYLIGNVLSLDIGASTTDLAIVKNGIYLDKSGQTYKNGGNIAREYLIDAIRAQEGFDLPIEDAEIVIAEGRLQLGNGYKNVSEIVAEAKRHFAKSVANQMTGYFRKVNIPIQSIRAIVVSGGGSLQSQYIDEDGEVVVTSKPMSFYITESLKEICAGVEVESYGESPRLANISGLFIRAKVDAAKKAQLAAQG